MPDDQDQQTPTSDQPGMPAGSLPGNAFVPAPAPPGQRSLPGEFFNWDPAKQRDFLAQPDTLPRDLPERTLKTAARAAPAVGAGLAVTAAQFIPGVPEGELAGFLANTAIGGAAAFLGGGGGSLVKSGVYKGLGDEDAPKTWKETLERAGIEGWDQAKTELEWGTIGKVAGKALTRVFGPERAYQRLLKPPPGRGQKVSGEIVRTGLQERISLTEGGAAKLTATIDKVNKDIENMISTSPGNLSAADYVSNIEKRMDILRKRYSKGAITGGTEGASVATIDEAEKKFLVNHGNVKPLRVFKGRDPQGNPIWETLQPKDMSLRQLRARAQPMTTETAQAIKKQTYEELRTLYQEKGQMVNIPGWSAGTHPGVATEATQELTRALREELGKIYPGLNDLNARDGRLLDLEEAVNRFVNRELNKSLSRYTVAGFAGGALAGGMHAGAGAGSYEMLVAGLGAELVKLAIDDPAIGSNIAIALHGIGKIPGAPVIRFLASQTPGTYGRYRSVQRAKAGEHAPSGEWVPRAATTPGLAGGGGDQAAPPSQAAEPGAPSQEPAPGVPSQPAAQDTTRPPLKKLDQEALTRSRGMKDFTGTYGWSNDEERMLQDAARKYDVPLSLLLTVAEREGSGKYGEEHKVAPRMVRSPAGAIGLMQIMPDTAKNFGYDNPEDMTDPQKNIEVSARYLSQLLKNPLYQKNLGMVLAAYNAGEKTMQDAGYNLSKMKKETRGYVLKGLRRWAQLSMDPQSLETYLSRLPTEEEFEKNIPQ